MANTGTTGATVERVGIYCRISDDPRKLEEGVTRQREDCEALCASRGWPVAEVHVDNDLSAYSGKTRPAYEALMDAMRRGQITRIVAYHQSRLWRNNPERHRALEELGKRKVPVHLVRGIDIDFTDQMGTMVANIMGEFDAMESAVKAERVARAALGRAEQGKANSHVAYGWARVYTRSPNGQVVGWHDVEDPEQADVVRTIVARLLHGDPLRVISRALDAAGVPTPRTAHRATAPGENPAPVKRWGPSTVRNLAVREANVGIRVRGIYDDGRLVGQERYPAAWPAIVDTDQHARVVALIKHPARTGTRSGARLYLLTYGIGRCGVCGAQLRAMPSRNRRYNTYACAGGGCTTRPVNETDNTLTRAMAKRLTMPDALDLLTPHSDPAALREAQARVAALEEKLNQLARDFDADLIMREQFHMLTASTRTRLVAAEAERDGHLTGTRLGSEDVKRATGPGCAAWWESPEAAGGPSLTTKIALLETLRCRVTLLRAKPGPGFDHASVLPTFGLDVLPELQPGVAYPRRRWPPARATPTTPPS
jgi:site-specific DNA recombinase